MSQEVAVRVIPPPFKHQTACLERIAGRRAFALLMEAGTGKTKIIIDDAARMYLANQIDTLIVIAPNNVHRNWIEQLAVHMPDNVQWVAAYWSTGLKKSERDDFNWVATTAFPGKILRILTFNIEYLSKEAGFLFVEKLIKRRQFMLVVDESHKIKSPSSTRSRSCFKLAAYASWKRILSGTAITKGYEDLWSQFKFLDPQIINCRTFAEFKSRYCKMGGFEGRVIVGYNNIPELLSRIAKYSFEINKRDCLDLPPETFIDVEVELSPEQIRIYTELKEQFLAEIRDGFVLEVPMAMTRTMRLQQIVSGFVGNMETKETENIPCPRLKVMTDLCTEATRGKVIVWCQFRADVRNCMDALNREGIAAVSYFGDLSPDQRHVNLHRFRTDESIRVLVATRATGGTGLDINEADTVINYSHGFKSEERIQAHARNMRPGQVRPCTYYDLKALGTTDIKCLETLKMRKDLADTIKTLDDYRRVLEGF